MYALNIEDYRSEIPKVRDITSQAINLTVCSNVTAFSKTSLKKSEIQILPNQISEINLPPNSKHEVKQDSNGGFDYVTLDEVN